MSLYVTKQHTAGIGDMAPHILNLGIVVITKQVLKLHEKKYYMFRTKLESF